MACLALDVYIKDLFDGAVQLLGLMQCRCDVSSCLCLVLTLLLFNCSPFGVWFCSVVVATCSLYRLMYLEIFSFFPILILFIVLESRGECREKF